MAWSIPFDHWAAWIRMIDIHTVLFALRNIFFFVTAAFFLYGFALNWFIFYEGFVRRRKTASWVPIFIGVIGAISLVLSSFAQLRKMWWLPPLIEWGCVPGMAYTAVYYWMHRNKKT